MHLLLLLQTTTTTATIFIHRIEKITLQRKLRWRRRNLSHALNWTEYYCRSIFFLHFLNIQFFTKHFHWGLMVHCMLYVVKESGCRKKMKEIEFMRAGRSLQWQNLWMWKHDNVTFHLRYKRSCCMFVSVAVFFCNVALAVPSHRHIVWYFLVCRRFTFFFFPVCSFCMTLLHSPPLLSLT